MLGNLGFCEPRFTGHERQDVVCKRHALKDTRSGFAMVASRALHLDLVADHKIPCARGPHRRRESATSGGLLLVCKVKHDLRSGCRDVLKIERGAVPLASTPKARPCGMVSIRSRQRRRDRAPGPCRPRRRGWRGQQWDAVVGSAESAVGLHPLAWLERNQRGRRIHVSLLWSVMYRLATSRKHLRTWPRPPPRRPAGGLFHPICLP